MFKFKAMQSSVQKRIKYLLWERNSLELGLPQRIVLRQFQTITLVVRDFTINQCLLRASALTYYTMLSLVPLLGLTFALLKTFGVQNLLQPWIIEKLNVGDGQVAEAIMGLYQQHPDDPAGGLWTYLSHHCRGLTFNQC